MTKFFGTTAVWHDIRRRNSERNVAISRARDGLIIVGDRELATRAGAKATHLNQIALRLPETNRGKS